MSGGPLSLGAVVERYEVEAMLGEGGMAVVYRVRHKTLGTAHALKVLTSVGFAARERLLLEGRAQAALSHPNILAVTDVLDVDGAPGLLMEYVPTPSLASWLERGAPPLDEALALFRGIVRGVQHAHKAGFVHRDLKPGNVLLVRDPEGGWVPRVADFGITKHAETPLGAARTGTGVGMGTPRYMAPEQFRDARTVDARADIYSLGCILVELLTGAPAYPGTDVLQIYAAASAGELRPLPEGLPVAVRRVVEGCLAPEAADRFADCAALLACLDGAPPPRRTQPTLSPGSAMELGAVDVPTRVMPPRATWTWGAVALLVGLLGLIGGCGMVLLLGIDLLGEEPVARVEPSPPAPEEAPAVVEAPPEEPATTEVPVVKTAPPPRAPIPKPSPSARVTLSGDATRVEAEGEAGRFPLPGTLPAGTYSLTAWFPSNPAARAGKLTVQAGEEVRLQCQSAFSRCAVQAQ